MGGSRSKKIAPHLQEARDVLAKAFLKWRERNSLSQQNIHEWARDKGSNGPHNSQVAFLERGQLDPKQEFWEALETLNKAIGDPKEKFIYVTNEVVRDRLQKATPFLTKSGDIAGLMDFLGYFYGRIELNPLYITRAELTDEFCSHYGHSLEAAFNKIARERMLTPKRAWQELTKVDKFPQDPEYQAICQDVLRGAHELTKEEALNIVEEYAPTCGGQCPCYHALAVLADDKEDPVDISNLKKENETLLETLSTVSI